MAKEIERKFLVTGDAWREKARKPVRIRQGYLAMGDGFSVRVRIIDNASAVLGIKASTDDDRARDEFEYKLPVRDARQLIKLAGDRLIIKRRYTLRVHRKTWTIDAFEGAHAGLVVAEIELIRRNESFEPPDWLGEEVTGDPRFSNTQLAFGGGAIPKLAKSGPSAADK